MAFFVIAPHVIGCKFSFYKGNVVKYIRELASGVIIYIIWITPLSFIVAF